VARSWVTAYVCHRCGEGSVHVELSSDDDLPHGLPFTARLCPCGGFLMVDRLSSDQGDIRRRNRQGPSGTAA